LIVSSSTSKKKEPGAEWTFLTNHSHVLLCLAQDPDMVLREVAARVGITERAVQKIVADLTDARVIARERVGRRNHYRIDPRRPLRHPVEAHRTVADLLRLVER
jgi:DNA-binding MarR family transcriptional regulator